MTLFDELLKQLDRDLMLDSSQFSHQLKEYIDQSLEDVSYRQALLEIADYYQRHYQLDAAVTILTALDKVHGEEAIDRRLALVYADLQDWQQVQFYLQRIAIGPEDYELRLLTARSLLGLGQFRQSEQALTQLVKDYPTQVSAYEYLVNLYIELERLEQAVYYLEILMNYFETEETIRNYRKLWVQLALEQEIVDLAAIEHQFQRPDLVMEEADEYFLLGQAYQLAGCLNAAYDQYIQAQNLTYDYSMAHELTFLLADLAGQLQDAEHLDEHLNKLTEAINPYDEELVRLAELAHQYQWSSPTLALKMADYLPLAEDPSSQYQLLSWTIHQYLRQSDIVAARTLLDDTEFLFDPAYLSYLYALINQAGQGSADLTEELLQAAIEYMVPEPDLVVDAVQFFQERDLDYAQQLSRSFKGTQYDNERLKRFRVEHGLDKEGEIDVLEDST